MVNATAILLAANELGKQHADVGNILKTVGLGVGTVFLGLVCIIFLCKIMSFFVVKLTGAKKDEPAAVPASSPAAIENRGALAAAIAAAVAEETGTDVSGIRIVSIKRK